MLHVLDHLSLHMTGSFAGHLAFKSTALETIKLLMYPPHILGCHLFLKMSNPSKFQYMHLDWLWFIPQSWMGAGSLWIFLFPPFYTQSRSSETVGFEARHKEEVGMTWLGTRSGSSKLHQHAVCMACIYVYKLNLGGQNNYFGGTKSVWSPQMDFKVTKE